MSYESAPATQMLATQCACCAKELLDAESVQRGVGPECARRHGFGKASRSPDWEAFRATLGAEAGELEADAAAKVTAGTDHAAHAIANRLVHAIACEQAGERVKARVVALAALGFDKLAARVADRLGAVRVEADGEDLVVKAPYSDAFIQEARRVPGARWDAARKARVVPASSRPQLWSAIRAAFPGALVIGGRGMAVA